MSAFVDYVEKMRNKGCPPIFEERHLARLLGASERVLANFQADTEQFYRRYDMLKKSGGTRSISVPSPFVLHAQRWISTHILSNFVAHDAAHGFVPGKSVVSNANCHVGCKKILKIDLKDFFPSIHIDKVREFFQRIGYPTNVSVMLASLCCFRGSLPQGGATSPTLSNLLFAELDADIEAVSLRSGCQYTRYADDIAISGERIDQEFVECVSKILQKGGFTPNDQKTKLIREGGRKIVCGVSIGENKIFLPRNTVRRIKLEAYHILKWGFVEHMSYTGHYDPILLERVIGRLGFWLQVDPANATAKELFGKLLEYKRLFDERS